MIPITKVLMSYRIGSASSATTSTILSGPSAIDARCRAE